jgi:hypothetical protein
MSMNRNTINNYSRFFKLIANLGMKPEDRKWLVSNFTHGRTDSLKELSYREYADLCKSLEPSITETLQKKELRKWRSNCLHLLQKCDVNTSDWDCVNYYCKNPKIAGKAFAMLTIEELQHLCRKLRSIQKKGNLKSELNNLVLMN